MITRIYKFFLKLAPEFFYKRLISIIIHKKPFDLKFLSDKYIYKSIDKGYAILYKEYNFGKNDYIFTNFNCNLSNINVETLKNLHSFNWLQDLKIIETQISNLRIFELIDTWINNYGMYSNKVVFDQSVLAARIFNWLTSSSIRNIKEKNFEKKFINSLSFQIRLFSKLYNLKKASNSLLINKTLFVIGRALSVNRIETIAINNIILYLRENILADGGMLDKSPSDILEELEHIIFVFRNLNTEENIYKNELRTFVDKIIIFIKSIRYKDGGLGVFNGGYEEDANKINFLLSLGNINAKSFSNLRYSGYLSLTSSNIDVMLKTNSILLDKFKNNINKYNNSLLSQEVTINGERIFVNNSNSMAFSNHKIERNYYSTLLFYDKNNKLIDMPSRLKAHECKASPKVDQDWSSVTIAFNGLESSFGLIWYKFLNLAKKKNCLLGEELIKLKNNSLISKVILKFILHPSVIVKNSVLDTKSLLLEINNEEWIFRSNSLIKIENELYQGIRDELFPTISINLPMDMKKKSIEWSIIQTEYFNEDIVANYIKEIKNNRY